MSFDNTKTDAVLGEKIRDHLQQAGVETPLNHTQLAVDNSEKIPILKKAFTTIWETLGLDLNDDSLAETPSRMAKMYTCELYWGLRSENFPKCTTIENKMGYDEMVVERDVSVQSNCEHHGVVIDGLATVAYIPKNKVLGLSKINRVVEYFSKRPQVQERLTEQVYYALRCILETDNIAVVIDAQHYCVKSRGVEDVGSSTITSKLGGVFRSSPEARAEFMNIVNSKRA